MTDRDSHHVTPEGATLTRRQGLFDLALTLLLTSLAFALVHLGSSTLVALTFVAAFFWSWIYARHPNLWPLGISHGILAALTYPLVLGDNPLQRF